MENNEGNLYCQIIFLNFGGEMEAGWFRVNDEKKKQNKSPFETIFDPIS